MQKNVDPDVSWERDAATAVPMAVPVLLLAESATKYTESCTGLEALASLASNRVTYALMVFVPVWLIVFLGYRHVNRARHPNGRINKLFASSTVSYRRMCLVFYFVIPAIIFIMIFF